MRCREIIESWLWWCFQVLQIFSSLRKGLYLLNSEIHAAIHRYTDSEKTRDRKSKLESKESKERERGREMMQWELSLMWEQHGRKPDTWGHFHFLCQLWQTAISTAEENISHSFSYTHFTFSTLHPSQITLLFFQVPKQYVILSKLDINELSMMGLKMTSNGCLISYTACPKHVLLWKEWKKLSRSKIWLVLFLAGAAGNFFRVSSLCFMLVVCHPSCPKTFQN